VNLCDLGLELGRTSGSAKAGTLLERQSFGHAPEIIAEWRAFGKAVFVG
jgi:hypothetical protein